MGSRANLDTADPKIDLSHDCNHSMFILVDVQQARSSSTHLKQSAIRAFRTAIRPVVILGGPQEEQPLLSALVHCMITGRELREEVKVCRQSYHLGGINIIYAILDWGIYG